MPCFLSIQTLDTALSFSFTIRSRDTRPHFSRPTRYTRPIEHVVNWGPPKQEHTMSTIHLLQTTSSTPEQFVAGLTDFGPGRSKLFGNSTDAYLKVHHRGPSDADVTEGSNGIWERLHYDWSNPNRVVMTTTDSNLWGGASGHTYTFTRRPDGKTDLDAVVVRDGKHITGKLLGFVLGIFGERVLGKALEKTVQAIEARNSPRAGKEERAAS